MITQIIIIITREFSASLPKNLDEEDKDVFVGQNKCFFSTLQIGFILI